MTPHGRPRIRYYAQYVLDTQSKQTAQRTNERYLRLIAFIVHQYLRVGDVLISTLRHAVTTTLNQCEQVLKDQYYLNRYATAQLVHQVSRRSDAHVEVLGRIEHIVENTQLDDSGKVDHIRQLLTLKGVNAEQLQADRERLQELKQINQPIHQRDDFYIALEKESLRLQARVAGIVQELVFDQPASHPPLMAALLYFQERKGDLSATASLPLDFLGDDQRQRVFTESGKLRPSLYKALLFWHLRDHLRDGSLNVLSSYEHRAFEEYMLPRTQWQVHRDAYLAKANLTAYRQPELTLARFNQRLNEQFRRTNQRLATNPQVYFDAAGAWHLHRYRADEADQTSSGPSLYPTNRVISLSAVGCQ